jgi:hypothetical protein
MSNIMERLESNPTTCNTITEEQLSENQALVHQVFDLYCSLINTGYEDVKMVYDILVNNVEQSKIETYIQYSKKRYDTVDKYFRVVMSSYNKIVHKTLADTNKCRINKT